MIRFLKNVNARNLSFSLWLLKNNHSLFILFSFLLLIIFFFISSYPLLDFLYLIVLIITFTLIIPLHLLISLNAIIADYIFDKYINYLSLFFVYLFICKLGLNSYFFIY